MFRITRTTNVELVRALHALTFPLDEWIGDDREFWLVRKDDHAVGFAAAMYQPSTKLVSLDRAGVLPKANGLGIQRRLIKARIRWAGRMGAKGLITYTSQRNYQSMVNLLKCGFRFYIPEHTGEYEREDTFHFLRFDF